MNREWFRMLTETALKEKLSEADLDRIHSQSYLKIFHFSSWQKASQTEKIKALQFLEYDYALKQGRYPAEVKVIDMNSINNIGSYGCKENRIYLNLNHLESKYDYANYLCLAATLHEGRHAYQHVSINNKGFHENEKEVQLWKMNSSDTGFYYSPDERESYRFQPVEIDANDYAEQELSNCYQYIKDNIGSDERSYKQYFNLVERGLKIYEKEALKVHGPNYIEKIEKSIEREYNNQLEQKNLNSLYHSNEQKNSLLKEAHGQTITYNSSEYSAIMKRINELYKQLVSVRDIVTEAVEERKELSQVIKQKEKDYELEI